MICKECTLDKPPKLFNREPRNLSGRRGTCRACSYEEHQEWRRNNVARNREISRRAYYVQRAKGRPGTGARGAPHVEHCRVNGQLRHAVASGRIEKPKVCEVCGVETLLHGHHDDYSKPFDVQWVCPRCHGAKHRKSLPVSLGMDE